MFIRGTIKRVTYNKNGYCVVKMQCEDEDELVAVTGYNSGVVAGSSYEVTGEWV